MDGDVDCEDAHAVIPQVMTAEGPPNEEMNQGCYVNKQNHMFS